MATPKKAAKRPEPAPDTTVQEEFAACLAALERVPAEKFLLHYGHVLHDVLVALLRGMQALLPADKK